MMSRITLSLKREAFRDPDMTIQYSTVVIAGRYEHDAERRGTFGVGTWRAVKQRKTSDFPPWPFIVGLPKGRWFVAA